MARKILLADDSVTAQNMGRKILADAGYEVITVNNGSAALKKISEQRPDLIVLDVYMPGYSGLEVCQRLKDVGETSRIPILLTVGKLEPFKPEEVRRVRADGFIVKPFEASELLSALSKLEDRVVPRAESSKPGRFARATAAVEEGRYDKTVAIEEDSGWKNRIAFPSKKKGKEKDAEKEAEDSAVDNPVKKDLRTVIEHKIAETPSSAKEKEENRVDLGALAPAGLPKDVTPEEIAALAAAAAQMQGKIAESKVSEPQSAPAAAAIEVPKPESHEEVRPEPDRESATHAATFAEHKPQDPVEAKPFEAISPSSVPGSDNGSAPHGAPSEPRADEPVTMAVGGLTAETAPSRWTAVSVALAPEEAAISLEQEMQKAYAAFAAAETGHAGSTSSFREAEPAGNQDSAAVENVSAEPVLSVPASAAPEAAQTLTEVASAATDAMGAAAEKLEAVAASYVEPKEAASTLISESPARAPIEATAQTNAPAAPQSESAKAESANLEVAPHATSEDLGREGSKDISPADVPSVGLGEIPVASAGQNNSARSTEITSEEALKPAELPTEKRSDIAATTSAAWANWRQTRESTGPENAAAESASPQDLAAKAVAAGAESSPEDVPVDAGSDPAIASIVDSVLADLRPKIVEEISRKLGKKK